MTWFDGNGLVGVLDALESALPFAGVNTFMKRPRTRDVAGADLVVVGVPFDSGTTYRSGARFGPRAIREQSAYAVAFEPHYPWTFKLAEQARIVDFGDIAPLPGTGAVEFMLEATEAVARLVFEGGANLLVLGGDHTVPLGPARAASARWGPLALVHIDAHQDSYDASELGGERHYNHGVFAAELAKEGCVDIGRSSQLYVRTHQPVPASGPYHVVYADDAIRRGPEAIADEVRSRVGDRPTYLTIDIDALDPAFAPGSGSPVPGGPSTGELRRLLHALEGIDLVAADIVEVNPLYDPAQITAVAAAFLAADLLHLMAVARGRRA